MLLSRSPVRDVHHLSVSPDQLLAFPLLLPPQTQESASGLHYFYKTVLPPDTFRKEALLLYYPEFLPRTRSHLHLSSPHSCWRYVDSSTHRSKPPRFYPSGSHGSPQLPAMWSEMGYPPVFSKFYLPLSPALSPHGWAFPLFPLDSIFSGLYSFHFAPFQSWYNV